VPESTASPPIAFTESSEIGPEAARLAVMPWVKHMLATMSTAMAMQVIAPRIAALSE
jgi:hypothetical protein